MDQNFEGFMPQCRAFRSYIRSFRRKCGFVTLTVAMALKQGVRFTDFAKLWWKLDKVNIRTFCYYDFFMLGLIAEIWPKTSN